MSDPKSRFSNRVQDYVRYRPHYPDEAIQFILESVGLPSGVTIADIGAGTGISAEPFLKRGSNVIGIEPNREMREAGEGLLSTFPNYRSVEGSAEKTTLETASVDMVISGQAFHWFDRAKAKVEFARILKPGGPVVLFWNERLIDATEFLTEYEALIKRFATDYAKVDHRRMNDDVIAEFFGQKPTKAVFKNEQRLDFEGLWGRLISSSYVPEAHTHEATEMKQELLGLFDKYSTQNQISLLYETLIYIQRLGD